MAKIAICLLVLMLVNVQNVFAGPRYRIKRVSDAHLADLQSRIALNKVKGIAITMPVGGGKIDPRIIGRRRRSQSRILDVLLNQSEEDKESVNDYDEVLQRLWNFQ